MANVVLVKFPVGSNQKDESVLIRIQKKKAIIQSSMHAYQKTLNCSSPHWSKLERKLYRLTITQITNRPFKTTFRMRLKSHT